MCENAKIQAYRGAQLITAPPSYFDTPSRNSDHTFNYGGNDFNFSNSDIPLSPSQDAGRTTSMFTEYHPYLSGKINKI